MEIMMKQACEHFEDPNLIITSESKGCEECVKAGRSDWVYLRLCLTCGQIGCCDNSPGKHATAHFHETGHPVIRGFQEGETWAFCFVDDEMYDDMFAPLAFE